MNCSRRFIVCCILLSALAGCSTQDTAALQQARTQAAATLQDAQIAHDQIQQQLTTLPADDPVRQKLQGELDQLDQIVAKAQAFLPALDAAIKSTQAASIDPTLQQAAGAIPYGSLALAAITLVFGVVKHLQAGNLVGQQQQTQKAFEQVLAAMDAAIPAPTPEQKAKVDAVLDTDVKAKVAAARSA